MDFWTTTLWSAPPPADPAPAAAAPAELLPLEALKEFVFSTPPTSSPSPKAAPKTGGASSSPRRPRPKNAAASGRVGVGNPPKASRSSAAPKPKAASSSPGKRPPTRVASTGGRRVIDLSTVKSPKTGWYTYDVRDAWHLEGAPRGEVRALGTHQGLGHQDLPKGDRSTSELRWIVEHRAGMVTAANMSLLPPGLLHSPAGALRRDGETGLPLHLVVPSGVTTVVAWDRDPPSPPPPAPAAKKASKKAAAPAADHLPKAQQRYAPPHAQYIDARPVQASRL